MPSNPPGPVLARKRLGATLRKLREQRHLTLDQVATALMVSVSKLSRLENAQGAPQLRDVRDLVNYFEISDVAEGRSLMRWAQDARQKGWWSDYYDVIDSDDLAEFIGYENEATVSLQFSILVVPGLLQTEAYARTLLSHLQPTWSTPELERVVALRKARQRNVTERDSGPPLELRVVMHEAFLSQSIGSSTALREQLVFLQNSAKADNIHFYIYPASADPHPAAIMSMWSHFAFGEDVDRDVAFIETQTGFRYIEDEPTVHRFERWFSEMARRSMDTPMSIARIQDAIDVIDGSERGGS